MDEELKNLKPNSHKYREEQEEQKKDIKAVVPKGSSKIHKKSLGRKFAETFIKSDVEDVKNYILFDLVVPSIVDTFRNTVNGAVDMFLYGDYSGRKTSSRRSSTNGRLRSYNSYSRYYYDDPRERSARDDQIVRHPPRGVESEVKVVSHNLAKEVRDGLLDAIDQYGNVSVADLYTLADIGDYEYPCNNWGWDYLDVDLIRLIPYRGGEWIVSLPRPKPLKLTD